MRTFLAVGGALVLMLTSVTEISGGQGYARTEHRPRV